MRVRVRSEHARHEELRLRETFAQHAHERECCRRCPCTSRRGRRTPARRACIDCSSQAATGGAFQPRHRRLDLERALARRTADLAVNARFSAASATSGVERRRQTERQLERGVGPQHVARVRRAPAMPSTPVTLSVGRHVLLSSSSNGSFDTGARPATSGNLPATVSPSTAAAAAACWRRSGGNGALSSSTSIAPDAASSTRASSSRRMRKLEGTMPLAEPECTPSRQHVDAQRADEVAAQRGRAPELLVVAAFGVEADDEARRAEAIAERCDVVLEIGAAAFLAGLDQHDAARVRDALRAQRVDRRQRSEQRVAVVGAAAAIQLARRGSPASQGPSPAHQPENSGCLSRWPYISTQSSIAARARRPSAAVCGPASRRISTRLPGSACASAHARMSCTARSM